MERHARFGMAATLPLYLGPLLAGFGGMGWSGTPVFVALMALWFVVMRPHQWPRQMAHWTSEMAVSAAAQVAISAVIVVVLFAIGRGIAGVAALSLAVPLLVPVGLSFLAIPLSWMVAVPRSGPPLASGAARTEDPMLAGLLALPEDADPVLIAEAVDAALSAPGGHARMAQLAEALDKAHGLHLALREGVILWATDAASVGRVMRDDQPAEGQDNLRALVAAVAGHGRADDPAQGRV